MYASQTKRLCVRGTPPEETKGQHQSLTGAGSNIEATNDNNMTASTPGNQTGDENKAPMKNATTNATAPVASIYHSQDRTPMTQQHQQINNSNQSSDHNTTEHELIDRLTNATFEEARLDLILSIRNLITACNKRKDSLVHNPNFSKIIRLIDDDEHNSSSNVKTQLALLLCSIAKGGEQNVKILNDSLVDDKIFNLILNSHDDNLIEACLRCMRSIMSWPRVSRTYMLYENHPTATQRQEMNDNHEIGPRRLIEYAMESKSLIVQECVSDIFAATCGRNKDQILLLKSRAIPCVVQFLESSSYRVIIASLNWLTTMCLGNPIVSFEAIKTQCPSGLLLLDRLTTMMNKDECYEVQFLASRCFAHIYRALAPEHLKDETRIVRHVLPTLVRMVHRDKPLQLRAKAAECIAYLIECETRLQNTASICDHLIESLANMLEYEQNLTSPDPILYPQCSIYKCSREREVIWKGINGMQQDQAMLPLITDSTKADPNSDNNLELNQEMRRSAFLALAALASNLESIRKKIFNTCSVMQHLVKSLTESDTKTLKSVLTCLLSLSRSVQQLRTSFAENSVYSALKNLLGTSSNDVLILVLAILCNISLDFSPGKQHFLDSTTIGILCNLTRGSDSFLRLHGMWILMNMVYQLKDQNLKFQILRTLGPDYVANILENEQKEELIMKTLGFLRNILSQRNHIDAIMSTYGEQIIQSLIRVLERPCSLRCKEQAICVLTNIADGIDSKAKIMESRVVLTHLARYIGDDQAGDLRLAAICCITNLARKESAGSSERRDEMKNFGIEEKLKSLLNTNDPILSDRVRTAYNQFLIGIEDKYVN